ncbi:type II toxin-antitoxin system HipA family toxin [Marinoscillum sp.]|uniref:type II toxin-antitoxin system HipA family toxin n=1 Tax=Marinoscillum sp. TaxID=2024838 RepID=UPI003BADADFC
MKLNPVNTLNVAIHLSGESIPLGRLALFRGKIYFEYDPEFLRRGLAISPFKLPLRTGAQSTEDLVFDGLHGVFNDSLPDGWGRLLLDRAVQARGVAHQSLTPLDRLAHVGVNAMGALSYTPDHSEVSGQGVLNLSVIAQEVHKVMEGESTELLSELLELGGSSAGARPKVLVGYHPKEERIIHGVADLPAGYEHWMIKFPSSLDQKDIAAIEYAYAMMAGAAGVEVPETQLFESGGQRYFGVKRFDREGNRRVHMHTAAGLLHADHRVPSLDYENLMRCALALTKDMTEVSNVFRLAAFNVFAHNRDDHSKNFSFLMDEDGNWTFAPAYDLTFSYGPGREHSSMVMGEGRNPGTAQLKNLGAKFQIKKAAEILEEVREGVSLWGQLADRAGVGAESKSIIQNALNSIR